MVKGVSRQVIVMQSPDPKLFEQAIFILKDDAVEQGITDEILMKEARRAIRGTPKEKRRHKLYLYGPAWACGGAMIMGLIWLVTGLL